MSVERQVDKLRISRAEEQAAHDSKEGRVLRRQIQKDALDHLDKSFLLYGPGIEDCVSIKELSSFILNFLVCITLKRFSEACYF